MKKIILSSILLVGMTAFFTSCKKSNNVTPVGNCPNTDSLYIFLSTSSIENNGFDYVNITVKDQSGNDMTSSCTLLLNNSQAITSSFVPASAGTFSISAITQSCNIPSQQKTVTVTAAGASPFTQKILCEDFTGAWCGYCPRVAYALEQYKSTHPNCISLAVHGGGGTDPYKFQYYSSFMNKYGATGFPTVLLNRKKQPDYTYGWSEDPADLDNALQAWAPLGLGITSTVNGNTVSGTAKVKFNVTTSRALKIVVALVENGLVYPQTNYYSAQYGATPYLYGGVSPINNFVHNNVLRRTATDLYGDAIPTSDAVKNNVWEFPFTMSLSGNTVGGTYNAVAANCAIIAFVVDGATGSPKGILNVQYANVGDVKDFD